MSAELVIQGTVADLFRFAFRKLERLLLCGPSTELLITSFALFFAHFTGLNQRLSQFPHLYNWEK